MLLYFNTSAQDPWNKERFKALSTAAGGNLIADIAFLSNDLCAGRATGTEGSLRASEWISRKFDEAGLEKIGKSWEHEFHVSGDITGRNIIGMLPGSCTIPCDRYIIVGAHYDHLGILNGKIYPGADSNASGVVAMTKLAEMFGIMRKYGRIFRCNIIFVGFDAREHGLKGSENLWQKIEFNMLRNPINGEVITKDQIVLMTNIDQIGSSLSPLNEAREDYMIMLGTESLPKNSKNFLSQCNKTNFINLDIALDYYGSANFTRVFYRLSDQRPFVENNIPATLFTSGITMNNNKTWDTADTINPGVMQKRVVLIYHWLEKMLQ